MAIPYAALPEGTRVKIVSGVLPQDPALIGRTGLVLAATEYAPQSLGVTLDGESVPRYFKPEELQVVSEPPLLPPEREAAKQRRALP